MKIPENRAADQPARAPVPAERSRTHSAEKMKQRHDATEDRQRQGEQRSGPDLQIPCGNIEIGLRGNVIVYCVINLGRDFLSGGGLDASSARRRG